ncbi:YfhO family protein [Fructobacillus sp. M2-14]|uniref:YfhO family protein n=1 Tax=Fructobacillus broussonetiae TaxID=2713173 RepID=A0ABS5R0A8_9LACO|nr:hypothetical protein [Fructobacillus broussonetiae]MBS9338878.1 YfhO family protein [Fructobacillus broussonetiae]
MKLTFNEKIQLGIPVILFGIAMAALLFMVGHNGELFYGADFQFHFNRMYEYHENIRRLNFFPTISTFSANQIGSNVIAMYPSFPTYLGALMLFVFKPILAMYILIWCQFMIQFLITRFVARKMNLENIEATTVAVIFVTSTALVSQSIQQWLLGETFAMSFMPLILLGLYRLATKSVESTKLMSIKENWNELWPLIVGFTAVLYSHVLSLAMVFVYFCIAVLYLLITRKTRVYIVVNVIIAGVITLLLSIAFLIPFLFNSLNNNLQTPEPYPFLDTWAAPKMLEIWNGAFAYSTNTIGLFPVISVILGLFLYPKLTNHVKKVFLLSILLVFNGSFYLWNLIYKSPLGVIQFPHRLLVFAILSLAFLFVFEIRSLYDNSKQRTILLICTAVFSIFSSFYFTKKNWLDGVKANSILVDYTPNEKRPVTMPPVGTYRVNNTGIDNLLKYWVTFGAFDYLPKNNQHDSSLLNHQVQLNSQPVPSTYSSIGNGIKYEGNFGKGNIKLPFITYNSNYEVHDKNGHSLSYSSDQSSQMVVKNTEATNEITVKRKASVLEVVSLIISFITGITLIIYALYRRFK